MESSLRWRSDVRNLCIHAKEKFPIFNNKLLLQVHGELDTGIGVPKFFALMIRKFYPELSTSVGLGLKYDAEEKVLYNICGKKAFFVESNRYPILSVKGSCDFDKDFTEKKPRGAAELIWTILNFRMDQDLRLKLGYEFFEKVPYLQVRENNWTLNADINGRWNLRYDL